TLDCHSWSWIGRGFPARAAEIAERARRTATSLESTVSVFWASCALGRAYASMGRLDQAGKAVPRPDRRMRRQDRLTRLGAELHVAVVAGDRERALAAAAGLLELAVTSARGRRHRWQERQAVDLASALGVQLPSAEEPGGGPAEPSERFVTVLFADVRDFTAISQKLAPALLAEKIASFQ